MFRIPPAAAASERRKERARALQKRFANSKDVAYVDAADYRDRDAMIVAVLDQQNQTIAASSVITTSLEVAEEVAIALAYASSSTKFVVSHSNSDPDFQLRVVQMVEDAAKPKAWPPPEEEEDGPSLSPPP
ncbi:hypothetical protein HPB47_020024 [Ixodes persulcatus]|uniref:Uncharacterized protein n=1 Tax=Ixodes persulcatus TaxID=34615 RepID=A0AC60QGM9_IXOPE|nr:hypothetical protein HPB47_020024 [Ixodes persulcatus]